MTERIVEAALALARRGWAVFPLSGKVPAVAGGRGVLDATTDAGTIAAWWRRYPLANVGARVPEHLVVVDVDPRNGGMESLAQMVAEHGQLPNTLTVWSGRGDGGRHLYWRRPDGRLSGRRLPAGLDLKTSRGYCVMPPSVHPEGRRLPYRWQAHEPAVMPGWLAGLLIEPPQQGLAPTTEPRPRSLPESDSGRRSRYLLAAVAGELEAVLEAPEGSRNDTLNRAAFALGQLVAGAGLDEDAVAAELLAAAVSNGLGELEAARTIASGLRAGRSCPRAVSA